jgi:hypothetical protein
MNSYLAFARDNRLPGLVLLLVIAFVIFAIVRIARRHRKKQRATAWQLKRTEQDRVWNERIINTEGSPPDGGR